MPALPTSPGFYLYTDPIGAPPEVVQVVHDGAALVVRWWCAGKAAAMSTWSTTWPATFEGPVATPAGPQEPLRRP